MKSDKAEIGVLYGFRALMVLFVANFHIWQQGWLGQSVKLFGARIDFDYFTRSSYMFVDGLMLLSGFLLYLPYAQARLEGGELPDTRLFYKKRAARILPSYFFAVLASLVLIALPQGLYRDLGSMWADILTHLTLTFTFSAQTYIYTPLNVALWSIAIEAQFYLIFPLLARRKRLLPTTLTMAALGMAYRAAVYLWIPDTSAWINQMPAFLDVYALGILGAYAYCRASAAVENMSKGFKLAASGFAAVAFAAACVCVSLLLRRQSTAGIAGGDALRLSQLALRLPFALAMLAAMLSAAFMPKILQHVLDNKLMRYISAISLNFYICHQTLSVQLRRAFYPDANLLHSDLNMQYSYTLLCFCASLVLAAALTYGIEKPGSRLLHTIFNRIERKRINERPANSKAQ